MTESREKPSIPEKIDPRTLAEMIVDTVREPMLVLEKDLRVRQANTSFYRHFHVEPGETVGQLVYDLGNGQWNIPSLRVLLEKVLHESKSFNDFEVQHIFGQIGPRSMLLNARRIDNLNLILLAMEDVTERKRTLWALGESEERFRQLADSMPQLVWAADAKGNVDYYNRRFREFAGLSENSEGFWEWAPVLHPEDLARTVEAWRDAVRSGKTYQIEHRAQTAAGSFAWVLSRAEPIHDASGRIVRWYGTSTDIDELKRTGLALEEAKKAAEAASLAKSEFLATMSHEIRTPMTAFLMALDHLLQIERSPEHRQLLEVADQSARRLRALIDDILDFSRIEARRVELEQEPFDLRACVEGAARMFALSARDKHLLLKTTLMPELPRIIVGDSGRLEQVLINLIGNAVKFTREGEIRLSVERRGDYLEFAVADTGIGIAEEKSDLIFDLFHQADSSFTRQHGGTGLGLAICKGLVEQMGGEISVRSRPGQGSVFTFTLPLKDAEEERSVSSETATETASEPGSAARILLAEDEPVIREMLTMMLTTRGWQAETANSGREAVEKWAGGDFDIILMDLQMPEMDGLEATREIRKREAENGSNACIIGLTAHARSEINDVCVEAGMDKVLIKPVRMADLYAAIGNCLSK